MSDTLDTYRRLADQFGDRVNAVSDESWDNQSPCTEWKTRDVVAHVVGVARGFLAQLESAPSPGTSTGEETAPEAASPAAAWAAARSGVETALSDPDQCAKIVQSPFGAMPFEMLVGRIVSADMLIHTWDLARAAGLDEGLDQDAVAHAYQGLKPADAMLRAPGLFAAKVEPPADADLQTEFLCFLGRSV